MALEYINAGGKSRPFSNGYKARTHFSIWMQETYGISEDKPDPDRKIDVVEAGIEGTLMMAFLGFKYGAVKAKEDFDFTEDDVEDWLDESDSIAMEVISCWNLGNAKPEQAEEGEGEGEPKPRKTGKS